MESGDEAEPEALPLDSIPIMDEAVQKLLESDDEDASRVLQRYDTSDPQFMSKAYDDMRKLDILLDKRFQYETGMRKKRKRHLKKLHTILSEFQSADRRHETENTRKFLSAINLQRKTAAEETLEEVTSGLDNTSRSDISSMSVPKRIDWNELVELEKQWALVPVDDDEKLSEETDSQQITNDIEIPDEKIPLKSPSKFSFCFDTVLPKIDHVKQNILLAGQLFTPEEKMRLEQLLNDPKLEKPGQEIIPPYPENPFSIFGEELKALQHTDEMLSAIKKSTNSEALTSQESSFRSCRFGFPKITDEEENQAASRRFSEITDRIIEIEAEEEMMLGRLLNGGQVEPLESEENIKTALVEAENDLLQITQCGEDGSSMALVPMVSKAQLNLVLGPFPRCTNYQELNAKQWNAKSFAMWKDWLEDRRKSLENVYNEIEDRKKYRNEEFLPMEDMEMKFRELMEDLAGVKLELDLLISNQVETKVK